MKPTTRINLQERPGQIGLCVNGEIKATFGSLGAARPIMNELACRLMEEFYPEYRFIISLVQGEDTLDMVLL